MKACKPLASEEVVYILIVLGGIVAGTGDLQIGMFHIKAVLSNVLIMICALAGGAGIGAAAGALAGIVPGMAFTAMPLLVGSYAFGGVIAGLGKNMGKIGVCVGFLLANIILCIYAVSYTHLDVYKRQNLGT